jgi:hypothetical protein
MKVYKHEEEPGISKNPYNAAALWLFGEIVVTCLDTAM